MDNQAIARDFVVAYSDYLFAARWCGGATLERMSRLARAGAVARAALDRPSYVRAVLRPHDC